MMRYLLSTAAAFLASAGSAYAQSEGTKALAEQLFKQGRELAKEDRWVEACPKFEASLRYDPALGTRLNLATCYERTGKLASAWGLYREVAELAKKAGDINRTSIAQAQVKALEPRLPSLRISVPAALPPGFSVQRGETTVEAGAFGVALYVDPGPHTITASAPGFESYTQSVTLVEAKAETLAIPKLVAKPEAPPVAEPPKPRVAQPDTFPLAAPPPPTSRTRKYLGLSVGAAGIAALGVGVAFGLKAKSGYDDVKGLCGADLVCDDMAMLQEGQSKYDDARSAASISTVLVIAGGAALVTGAVVYLTAPREHERQTARLVPVPQERGAGLAVVGKF